MRYKEYILDNKNTYNYSMSIGSELSTPASPLDSAPRCPYIDKTQGRREIYMTARFCDRQLMMSECVRFQFLVTSAEW
uniref:Uncharacterized protein n=1 Tax=Heterorhabditis bacteriophora TaxID=37862 RepID=A0A1I7WA04_HETBA